MSHKAVNDDEKDKKGEKGDDHFDPRTAIFVCNKWELIDIEERENVKEYVTSKLQKAWNGFDEDQVFFMSAQTVSNGLIKVQFSIYSFYYFMM